MTKPVLGIASRPACRLLAGAVASILVSAAAWAQPSPLDSAPVKELHEKAKAEGKVVMWGTNVREVDWIPKAFAARFPGIDVKVVGDNNITTTAIAEARANRHQVDVFWHSLAGVAPLLERGLVEAHDWTMFGVNADNTFADKRLAVTNTMVYSFMYNTKLADPKLLPKTWSDVLNPALKDKMVVSDFLIPRLTGALVFSLGHDKAMNFARSLRDDMGLLLTRAPRQPIVAAGERAYSMAELDQQVRLWKSEGLPVDYVVPEPVTASQFVAALMAKAPNPNAAKLLAGWLASDEGKAAREQQIFTADYRPNSKSEIGKKLLATGAKINFDDLSQVADRNKYFKEAGDIISGQVK
jgi:iron(III) transport system substrate-binding protein